MQASDLLDKDFKTTALNMIERTKTNAQTNKAQPQKLRKIGKRL